MRLAERLMLGSTMLKPLRGIWNNGDYGCALGMISKTNNENTTEFWNKNSDMIYKHVALPSCGCDARKSLMAGGGMLEHFQTVDYFYKVLVHLFNQHVCATDEEVAAGIKRWSIEQLADWLESVEPKEAENAEVLPVQECGEPERSCVGRD